MDQPITGLPSATQLNDADLFAIAQRGVTKNISAYTMSSMFGGGGGAEEKSNLAVNPDTPAGWATALGGDGNYWGFYSTAGLFEGQPSQYGIMETIIKGQQIWQRWNSQALGPMVERSGSAMGWNDNASITGLRAWTEINTNNNTGLAGNCIDMEATNLNDYPNKSGFYMGHDGANRPPTVQSTNDWWYVEQLVHNDSYRVQIARSFFNNSQIYQRIQVGGNWLPWVRITTFETEYPVGSVFISLTLSTPEAVATALGGGTWIRVFKGRTIVGVDESDTDFSVANIGGGSKTQPLIALVGSFNDDQTSFGLYETNVPSNWTHYNYNIRGNRVVGDMAIRRGSAIVNGQGTVPSTLQPYATTYIYQRTV